MFRFTYYVAVITESQESLQENLLITKQTLKENSMKTNKMKTEGIATDNNFPNNNIWLETVKFKLTHSNFWVAK